jgi:hypothetical protein
MGSVAVPTARHYFTVGKGAALDDAVGREVTCFARPSAPRRWRWRILEDIRNRALAAPRCCQNTERYLPLRFAMGSVALRRIARQQMKNNVVGKSYYGDIPDGGVIVFGMTSRGAECGTNQTPGIYASLHTVDGWLRASTTRDNLDRETKADAEAETEATPPPAHQREPSRLLIYSVLFVSVLCFFAVAGC